MKRKKQSEESINDHKDEPTLKRARSGRLRKSDVEEPAATETEHYELVAARSGLVGNTEEDELNAAPLEDEDEDDQDDDQNDRDEFGQSTEGSAEIEEDVASAKHTPKKRTNGGLSDSAKTHPVNGVTPGKRSTGKKLFSTPRKANGASDETPKLERHIDRSARRKSTRNLIERTVLGNTSDNDAGDEDIEGHIYGSGDEEEEKLSQEELGMNGKVLVDEPETPSKKPGRPKGSKNKQPSPPPTDLPPHELYFSQNRGGRSKTSNNNLSSLKLLDHEEYFTLLREFKDPHADDIEWLQELHAASFNQWQFELSQNFNLCLFGWGSKKFLLKNFAQHIYKNSHQENKIVIVNGFIQTLTIRDILNTVAAAVSNPTPKLGSQPNDMLENLFSLLEEDSVRHITIIIHSIDGASLRRPATQIILSRLSAHPQIQLVASADHPSFPLLWNSSLRSMYNFLFHDCTTFQPYSSEIDVVEEVHELMGRSGRRVGGKEGVSFVLKSLPENAKNLFRVLIGEQLAAMDDSSGGVYDNNNEEGDDEDTRIGARRYEQGVEYRVLYQKAVEEFICSNEMNFRTLLKEFHDHQMIESRKDALGTEMLSVPFRKEELEMILEDIVS